MYNHYRTVCVTRFHRFPLADTTHMCSDTIECTSSISPFLFQKQKAMKQGVVCTGAAMQHSHPPGPRCFNRRSCTGVEPDCFMRGVRARTQALDLRLASVGGPCLILHLLRQLHLETLFMSPAPELQDLLTKAMGFKSTAPDQEGLCVWDFFYFPLVWPTAYSRSTWGSVLVFLRSGSLRASSISETVALILKKWKEVYNYMHVIAKLLHWTVLTLICIDVAACVH